MTVNSTYFCSDIKSASTPTTDSSNPLADLSYQYRLYTSISQVDHNDWYQVVDEQNDIAMNWHLLRLTEKSLTDQADFWIVMIYQQQEPVAAACLCLFRADILQSAPTWLQNMWQPLRHYWPNCLKMGVLFCGLPVPCGHTHMRFTKKQHINPCLTLLNDIMQQLAYQKRASLIVFKELDEQQVIDCTHLKSHGFIHAALAPTYELQNHFTDFNHYQSTLRANYRRQIQQHKKKFIPSEFNIEHITDADTIKQRFTDDVHQLYIAVWQRSNEKLEQFPAHFFRELAYALPGKITFTLIRYQDNPIAFTIGIHHQEHYHNLYCGINYSLKDEFNLYFNLYYSELDYIFKKNVHCIGLGQTADAFKTRLGAKAHARYFFVRAKNRCIHLGLKYFNRWIFPRPPSTPGLKVFKYDPPTLQNTPDTTEHKIT